MSELKDHQTLENVTGSEHKKNSKSVSNNSRKHFKYRSNECFNCSQPLDLSDRYCPYCSQLNSTKPLSLKDFIEEFFSSFISYDSKLRFTVKDLLFKPGRITRNYVDGKRLKYTNPFRFFLSVSIVYFLLSSLINFFDTKNDSNILDFEEDDTNSLRFDSKEGDFYINDNQEFTDAIEQLEANPKIIKWADKLRSQDSIRKTELKDRENDVNIVNGDTINDHDYKSRIKLLDTMNSAAKFFSKFTIMQDFYDETKISSSNVALDSLQLPKTKMNNWLYSKNKTAERIEDDPYSFIEFLLSKTPFYLFFFAPFFALSFWLLYMKRSFTYMEHLVFIFHIFSFVFLVMLILVIPGIFINMKITLSIFFSLVAPFYFYKALRNFYKQSRIKTLLKFVILNFTFIIGASIAASIFFIATVASY